MLQIEKRHLIRPPKFLGKNGMFLLFLAGMALLGFLVQFQQVGYVVIAVYGATQIKWLSSRITFKLALATLGIVPIAILISNWVIAQNFAAYSFVLFIIGVVELIIELRREIRTK